MKLISAKIMWMKLEQKYKFDCVGAFNMVKLFSARGRNGFSLE